MLLVGLIRILRPCSDLAKGVVIRVRIILLVIPGCLLGSCPEFVCIGKYQYVSDICSHCALTLELEGGAYA